MRQDKVRDLILLDGNLQIKMWSAWVSNRPHFVNFYIESDLGRPTDGLNPVGVHEFDKLHVVNTSVLISWIIHDSRISSRAHIYKAI